MKILNIHGQPSGHMDARIIGNTEGLIALKKAIERVVLESRVEIKKKKNNPYFYASDGGAYELIIELHKDAWGVKDSYWNKPEYTSIEETT